MSESGPNPIVRLLPSLGDFAFLMPLVFLFGRMEGAATLLGDGDTGWHLRAGEWMLANGRVPDRDLFSFTRPDQPWFAWEWLWDVLFAWLSRHGGLATVVLANVVLLGAISVLVYRLARRVSGNAPIALGVALLASAGSCVHWLARPHLFTLLFTALFCTVLESGPSRRRMAVLAALTVLWTNLHGGFFVGIALLALYTVGDLGTLTVSVEAGERAAALRRMRLHLAGLAGCAAASLANPYGWRLHAHIWQYLNDPSLFREIKEFLPPNLLHPAAIYFEAALLAGAAAALWSLSRRRFTHAMLVAAWAHLALVAVRNVPIFLIVSAPVIALAAKEWIETLRDARVAGWIAAAANGTLRAARDIAALERVGRVHAASVAAVLVLGAMLYGGAPAGRFDPRFPSDLFPVGAAAALERSGGAHRIFANDQWGDYLIYTRFPRGRVFVDGRSDFYGAAFSKSWARIWGAAHGWQASLDRHAVDAVLVPPRSPLAAAMKESARWRAEYDDGIAIVFRPVTPSSATGVQSSVVGSSSGSGRDREITKSQTCDPSITTNQGTPGSQKNSGAIT